MFMADAYHHVVFQNGSGMVDLIITRKFEEPLHGTPECCVWGVIAIEDLCHKSELEYCIQYIFRGVQL